MTPAPVERTVQKKASMQACSSSRRLQGTNPSGLVEPTPISARLRRVDFSKRGTLGFNV